ncbi:exonuclease domain-containing protein [uncultured Parasutterella sp.]|uniref:exonuclease domain-containing protein n=1 Tax=uncultured Parasutterella sp. TaxID=1263098 RepID=UPI0025B5AC3C|nr:exonuclease domain-containing protein [uncultured Parasutterella sp.]
MTQQAENNTTYLWFDYETFGANAIKDRPAQFGAVRTDASFNVLGRPIILYSQLADDYLPSAGASLITGITPMTLLEETS